MEEDVDGGQRGVGSAPAEEEAGRAKQNVFFLSRVFVLFPLFGGSGEKEIRVSY